ncbi:DOMON domain-containing protein [Mycena venus]|uniref:DOMON domain-containing protein n=1 Tax=Mycena venus TaxID=2733690 RepID=A0A8H6Y456_9AGAR|nr:DOMON domain-containing protein [Mycena venus]
MWSLCLIFVAAFTGINAVPALSSESVLQRRTTISDGNAFNQGNIGNMTWQASGVLESGCIIGGVTLSTISDCYHMFLTNNASAELDTNHLDSPRQRDEFHFPQLSAGIEFSYTWKQYLYSSTGTGTTWFHLMQVFGVVEDNPLVTLDAVSGALRIKDYVRGTGGSLCGTIDCPTTNLTNYDGTTATHTISGMFGPNGSVSYEVRNTVTGDEIISYAVNGSMGAGDGYVKFGMYRLTFDGMTTANAAVGDWATL